MKKVVSLNSKILLLLFLFISAISSAQYYNVDEKVRKYPTSFSSARLLAERISGDFTAENERARAAFTWIALNIKYDVSEYDPNNNIAYSYTTPEEGIRKEKIFRQNLITKTLKSGQAICEGYASLFTDLCTIMGMDAEIIAGTSRNNESQIGKLPQEGDHAWNAVKVNGQWQLLDVTWAAGIVDSEKGFVKIFNDAYFFAAPENFFLNHFPDNYKWLLIDKTAKEFANQPFYYPSYIKSNYRLNFNTGILKVSRDNPLAFNIQNLKSTDRVYYITSRDNVLDKLRVDENNNFLIYPSSKLNGYLTIFINEKPIVSYRIVRG